MTSPTRYPAGVSTQQSGFVLGNYPNPDPSKVYTHFDDFPQYRAADWTVTTGANVGVVASAQGQGGLITLTTTAVTAADFVNIVSAPLDFNFIAGQEVWYSARLKLSEVTLAIALAGLVGSAPGATESPTSGIYFRKLAGSANVDLVITLASVSVTLPAVTTLLTNTNVKLGYYYNGKDAVTVYVNDVAVATQSNLTTLPVATALTPALGIVSGETVAKVMTVDWVLASQVRV